VVFSCILVYFCGILRILVSSCFSYFVACLLYLCVLGGLVYFLLVFNIVMLVFLVYFFGSFDVFLVSFGHFFLIFLYMLHFCTFLYLKEIHFLIWCIILIVGISSVFLHVKNWYFNI